MKLFKSIAILFFLLSTNLWAQEKEVLKVPQQKAAPYEGMQSFYTNFIEEFKAPNLGKDVSQINAKISFVVEKDGSFSNIKILSDSDEVTRELKRTFESMPKWKPAVLDGEIVKSSFHLPITIKIKNDGLSDEEAKFLKDLAVYEIHLRKYEQVTDSFKFLCNCVTSSVTSDPDNKSELFEYETLDKIGLYNISVSDFPKKEQKKFFKNLISDVKKSGVNYNKLTFAGTEGLTVNWIEKIEDKDVYYRTFFFFDGDKLFTLNFGAENSIITDLVFTNLLNTFQIKN